MHRITKLKYRVILLNSDKIKQVDPFILNTEKYKILNYNRLLSLINPSFTQL